MVETLILFVAAGLAGGFLAGLLGIGGGLIVVPVLYFWFSRHSATAPHAMHLALGSSLAFIVINSGAAAWMHARLDGIRWREVRHLAPGLAAGSLTGAALADALPTTVLARGFGAFMLAMAALLFLRRAPEFGSDSKPAWQSLLAGLPIGTVAALTGVGGGVMVVPWLLSRGYRAAQAVATSSLCTVIVAAVGAAGYSVFADDIPLDGTLGYVYWPAVLGIAMAALLTARFGARLAHRVDQQVLRKAFAVLVAVVGGRLLLAG